MVDLTSWGRHHDFELLRNDSDQAEQYSRYLKDPQSVYRAHAASQLDCGEGRNLISLNEPRRLAQSIGCWPDLLSFDIAYWNDQQADILRLGKTIQRADIEQLQPGFKATIPDRYMNQLRGEWIRLYYQERFVYGNLYSALHFILFKALIEVTTWLNSRYPYQLQRDSQVLPHNTDSDEPFHRESHYDYESIKNYFISHCSDYLSSHYFDLSVELNHQLNQQTPATYIIEYSNSKGLPCVDFICKNQQTLRMIRPWNFTEDMQNMVNDPQYLEFKAQQLAAKIANEIRSMGW